MASGYHHLQEWQRYKIEGMLAAKARKCEIYRTIGCSRSTLDRELERGRYEHMLKDLRIVTRYSAKKAQNNYIEKAKAKGPQLKIGNDHAFIEYIENKIIKDRYSPYAAVEAAKTSGIIFKNPVSYRTVYNYIDTGYIFSRVTRQSLWMKGQRKKKYDKIKAFGIKKPLRRSIEQRPKEISMRTECGHWEMDTVIGKAAGKNEVLLVLTERKSRMEIVRKIESKTQAAVVGELDNLEREYKHRFPSIFKSLTTDNGCEFLDDVGIERSVNGGNRTTSYFCHPYNSCERGSNENQNRMIRRFIPKGEDRLKVACVWVQLYVALFFLRLFLF